MHENSECITLRIFSGVHLGAEISLCSGVHVFGKDLSCDIILNDKSIERRHIQFNITQTKLVAGNSTKSNDDAIEVRIQNLDGFISENDEPLADNSELLPNVPYKLGQVCFAWFRFGQMNEVLASVQENLQSTVQNAISTPIATLSMSDGNNVGNDNGKSVGIDSPEDENIAGKNRFLNQWKRYLALLCVVLLLIGITVGIEQNANQLHNNIKILSDELQKNNFSGLDVGSNNHGVVVEGVLHDNEEYIRLTQLVQSMHFPVYYAVQIEDDLMRSILQGMHELSLYPRISINVAQKEMTISMYIKDELVLNGLVSTLKNLFPAFDRYKIKYNPHFETEIDTLLTENFDPKLKAKFDLEYLPGIIKVIGNLSGEDLVTIKATISKISNKLGIFIMTDFMQKQENLAESDKNEVEPKHTKPLVVYEYEQPDETRPNIFGEAENDTTTYSHTEDMQNNEHMNIKPPVVATSNIPSPDLSVNFEFKVTSVNLKPIKYIILSDERRVFVGGLLPGGYNLMDIALDVLTLEKNGSITTYELNQAN